jgi:hypothetical protein
MRKRPKAPLDGLQDDPIVRITAGNYEKVNTREIVFTSNI